MTDIKLVAGKWTGIPVFHRLTPESTVYADLYEAGYINACSIGGEAEWKTNAAGQAILKDGNRQCERFNLYEISIVTLPSNPDATILEALSAKYYDKAELQAVYDSILTLSSQFKIPEMSVKKTAPQIKLETLEAALAAAKAQAEPDADTITTLEALVDKAKLSAGGVASTDPSVSQLPGVIKDALGAFGHTIVDVLKAVFDSRAAAAAPAAATPAAPAGKNTNGAPAITDEPVSKIDDVSKTAQPTPTGLSAEQQKAKDKAEEMRAAAEAASSHLATCKEAAEKAGATAEHQSAYAAAFTAAETAMNAALEADEAYNSCMDAGDDGDADMDAKKKAKNATGAAKTTAAANTGRRQAAITPKTLEQLKADNVKLAPKPAHDPSGARVMKMKGTRFTDLSSSKNEEGQRIVNRVLTHDSGTKEIADYQVVLESIIADGKYAAMTEMLRVIEGVDESKLEAYRDKHPTRQSRESRGGMGVKEIMQQLSSGVVEVFDKATKSRKSVTTLTSTDNALASPALNTIEWLSLAIFELFPSTSWKDEISMFPAEMTSKNTGLIWANILAQPTVYRGSQPVNPADYQADDGAQSLTLIPYYLQPMLWNPISLHQLRYNKMDLQWAQSFAYWGSVMDDELIYLLSNTVPAGSIVQSTGYGPNPAFSLTAGVASPDTFYYNNAYTGSLAKPAYNDIAIMEQIMSNQNFDLAREKMQVVLDPTMMKYIKQDPLTQSLLTRWIESNSGDLLKISNTKLHMRSRVAAIDQAGLLANPTVVQIKDPTGVMPSTVISFALGFLASQVALGLGMLDVFVQQSPSNYGLRMSADMRIGAVPVRTNANGTFGYTYGQPTV